MNNIDMDFIIRSQEQKLHIVLVDKKLKSIKFKFQLTTDPINVIGLINYAFLSKQYKYIEDLEFRYRIGWNKSKTLWSDGEYTFSDPLKIATRVLMLGAEAHPLKICKVCYDQHLAHELNFEEIRYGVNNICINHSLKSFSP
jgi:adenylate cyclase